MTWQRFREVAISSFNNACNNMREGRRVAAQRVQGLTRSLSLLKVELTRLQDLLQEYNRAAENLRRQEDENR